MILLKFDFFSSLHTFNVIIQLPTWLLMSTVDVLIM